MAFCRNCGQEIPEGSKFCDKCGSVVEMGINRKVANPEGIVAAPISEGKFESTKRESLLKKILKTLGIVLACLVVFCIIAGIALYKLGQYIDSKNKTTDTVMKAETFYEETELTKDENKTAKVEKNSTDKDNKEDKKVDIVEDSEDKEVEGGVDPDLKEFLDSYEAFMDEYVEFMKKYNSDPSNAVTMINDYVKILGKYQEFAAKAENYKQEDMSKEDLAYYVDSMARIEKKLLEAM